MCEVSAEVLMAARIHMHNHRMGKLAVKSAENGLPLEQTNKPATLTLFNLFTLFTLVTTVTPVTIFAILEHNNLQKEF